MLIVAPLVIAAQQVRVGAQHWSVARWDSSGQAPDPTTTEGAVVQVYAARTWGWKGVFAVHSWIIMKPAGAAAYERYDVVGWGVRQGRPAVRRNMRPADGYWAGNRPELIGELRGPDAARAIPTLRAAIASYPHDGLYRTWPGPNSNSFVAHLARAVPQLRLEMPALAVGKDYLGGYLPLAMTPSGTGVQVSVLGLVGVLVALDEGLEVHLLGLVLGVDPLDLAIKLPGLGRIGLR